jgi:hypothetical protein
MYLMSECVVITLSASEFLACCYDFVFKEKRTDEVITITEGVNSIA